MEEAATSEGGAVAHFPPGSPAPTAEQKLAERLAKMNAAKRAFDVLPLEEKRRLIAERKAVKQRREDERQAKRDAKAAKKNGGAPPPTSPMGSEAVPPTVRSHRVPTTAPPDSDIPRRGSGDIRGLIDLCNALPHLGDGTCFIQVTRVKPPMAFGVPTAGVQKPLWDACDDAEFMVAYGGSEYSLRGYALKEGGKARALTEPVTYRVSGPPNLDSALTEDDAMRPNAAPPPANGHPAFRRPGGGGIVTPQAADAQARMHDRELTHEERLRDQRREDRRRERAEQEERETQRRDGDLNVARLMADDKKAEMERLQAMQERQLELVQSKSGDPSAMLVEVLKAVRPGEDTKGLAQQHAAEMRQMAETHKSELLRLTADHKETLERLGTANATALHRVEDQARMDRERADNLTREADKRAAEAVKEAERRAGEQIREAERRADQRVTDTQNNARTAFEDLRTRSEERLRDQNQQWQQRFDDLKANHDREIRQKDSEIGLMRSNLEGNMAVILAGKDTEIKRLQHDLRDWKDIAEKNKDWMSKMGEFEKTAEMMGFEKSGGEGPEEDLKTTAIKAGLGALTRLPEMITAGADALAKVRNPGVPPDLARSQARSGMVRESMRTVPRSLGMPAPVQMAPLTFATEEGGYTPPPDAMVPRLQQAPVVTQPAPLPPLEQSPSVALAQQYQPQQQLPLPLPEMQPLPQQAPVAPQPQPAPQAAPPLPVQQPEPAASAPPPPPSQEADGLDEGAMLIVQRFTPILAQQFEAHISAEEVAGQIVAENGMELARLVLSSLTAEQLIRAIARNPGQYAVLATRNGQKFLREIWVAAEKLVAE